MNAEKPNPEEQALLQALRALTREEQHVAAPPRVEARLLRAFDESRGRSPRQRRGLPGQLLKVAAVFVLAVASRYWWSVGGAKPPADRQSAPVPAIAAPWPSAEALSWLDAEPGSLQIVHVQMDGDTLAAQGYAVADPDGDGLVDLEVILGQDGMARGVRVAPATALIYD
jgi:hypothetical protein